MIRLEERVPCGGSGCGFGDPTGVAMSSAILQNSTRQQVEVGLAGSSLWGATGLAMVWVLFTFEAAAVVVVSDAAVRGLARVRCPARWMPRACVRAWGPASGRHAVRARRLGQMDESALSYGLVIKLVLY